jgi:hypothetical protein
MSDLRIWKYSFSIVDSQTIAMPAGAKVLTAQKQGKTFVMWAIVDVSRPAEDRVFYVYGTGNPIDHDLGKWVATVQDGAFVWHVFSMT